MICNLRYTHESHAITFGIGKTNDLKGLLAILNDETHVSLSIGGGINDDLLDLTTDQWLEHLDV